MLCKCDVSLTVLETVLWPLEQLQVNIVADNKGGSKEATGDIVMDNSGFDLTTDLCLAEFSVTSGIVANVSLRSLNVIKIVLGVGQDEGEGPALVSDTTQHLTRSPEDLLN